MITEIHRTSQMQRNARKKIPLKVMYTLKVLMIVLIKGHTGF